MKKYKWEQLSQWDTPKDEYVTQTKEIKTGLSTAICRFLLVEQIDVGKGYIRTVPINKSDIKEEMLAIAGLL